MNNVIEEYAYIVKKNRTMFLILAMKIVADAIENSQFVLICLSDSYKRDNRCQAQAEYASVCKKLLLPLIVHSGYKPDGWLIPVIGDQMLIDFEITNFETASQLLLEQIKRQQPKKNVPATKDTVSTSPATIRKSTAPRTYSDEPSSFRDHSLSSEVTMASSSLNSSISPAITDGRNSTSKGSKSRSSTPGINASANSAAINKLSESSPYSIIRQPTPVSRQTGTYMAAFTEPQQQPSISDSIPVHPSTIDNYQQRPPGQPVFVLSRPVSSASIASNMENRQQQQQNFQRPLSKSPTLSSSSSDRFITARIERQQLLQPARSEAVISVDNVSITSTFADRQQQLPTSTQPMSGSLPSASNTAMISTVSDKQQSQELMRSDTQSIGSTSFSSVSNTEAGIRDQPTTIDSMSKSELSSANPSNASTGTDTKQQKLQQIANGGIRPNTTNIIPPISHQQPSNMVARSLANGLSASPASVVIDEESQQYTRSYPTSTTLKSGSAFFNETNSIGERQHEKILVDSTPPITVLNSASPTTSTAHTRPESRASTKSNSKEIVGPALPPVVPGASNKQRRQTSVHSMPKSSGSVSSDMENQSPPIPRSTSNSILPMPATNQSSTSLSQYPLSQANAREQWSLLDKYINRKTDNSIYRTLAPDTWRNNDVLDFLCDARLHLIMPLCESMSGKALIRLVRMCQKKPTRLYDQLNEELRTRFKGLTLPMGTYTQFLTEMDALIGSTSYASPSTHDQVPKVVERVIVIPRTVQHAQVNSTPPALSSISSDQSNVVTLVDNERETAAAAAAPRSTRVMERAIYRPASNMGRPYNFLIESVGEPGVFLDQVYRYGNQFLVLDATAHQQQGISK